MNITITGPVTKLCPFKDERDHGTVRITYGESDDGPELHELADFLRGFADKHLTHEDFTLAVTEWVSYEDKVAVVESTWVTAGLEMTCSAVSGERVEPTGEAGDA